MFWHPWIFCEFPVMDGGFLEAGVRVHWAHIVAATPGTQEMASKERTCQAGSGPHAEPTVYCGRLLQKWGLAHRTACECGEEL